MTNNLSAIELSTEFLKGHSSDSLAVGLIDFSSHSFDSFQLDRSGSDVFESGSQQSGDSVYFDLASLSKPLLNSLASFSEPELVSDEMKLLLNHRGGLPAWGLLPKNGWKEILLAYPILQSETLYSDYSALRFMLEFNKASKSSLHEVAAKTWDEEIVFWKELSPGARTLQNGYISGKANFRGVHDPNAYNVNDHVSHAGLFGTIEGVCKTLLNFDRKFNLLETMIPDLKGKHERFVRGWDTVANPAKTLAGPGCGEHTFGHLGFTGTSIWIDPVKKLGHVILCNATKEFWHDKRDFNQFRMNLGELLWSCAALRD